MDNITLSKNQLQAILELVSQIGSNRSQNVTSLTSVTPAWERRSIDNLNGNNDFLVNQTSDGNNDKNEDFVTTILDNQPNTVNLSPSFGGNQIVSKPMETTIQQQSKNETLFWQIENGNNNQLVKHGPIASALEYSYPYFSHSISSRPLIKSQSLGAIECTSIISPSPTKDSTLQPFNQQLVSASSISSLIPPRTAPSTSQSLFSFDSSQGGTQVNFRRYARSVTSSLGGIVGGIGDPVDWEEKHRKMLKYRAELAAQKEEKARREREEKEKARAEEQAAERRMIAVQRRLKEEYELERRLIEEKREAVEKRRLAVVAAMEQSKARGKHRIDDQFINYNDHVSSNVTRNSVSTQTENKNYRYYSVDSDTSHVANRDLQSNYDHNQRSSSAQTDISLLFDLIRSLGFSTMTLKSANENDGEGDPNIDSNQLRYRNGLKSTLQRLNKTAKARLGRNGLKFDLNDNLTKTADSGSNQNKKNQFLCKSASHTNLTRIGKSRSEINQEKSSNRSQTISSSSANLFSHEIKPNRLKGIINTKKQSTSNLPLINSNQLNSNCESFTTNIRQKATKSTLEGIL